MHLNYAGGIPAEDLVGRLLGPDMFDAFVQCVAVEHGGGITRAKMRPVPADELHLMTRDQLGQLWLPLPTPA